MKGKDWEESAFASAFPAGSVRVMEFNDGGSYEGWGAGIAFDPATGEFLVAEYSHCSCNGPDEGMTGASRYDSLVDAVRGVTSYYRKDIIAAFTAEVG